MNLLRPVTTGILLALTALALTGCVDRIVDPREGDLTGQWLVNLGRARVLGGGTPVLAELRMENSSSRHVRISSVIAPELTGAAGVVPGVSWAPLVEFPLSLAPGQRIDLAWLLEGDLGPGAYRISTYGGAVFVTAVPCLLTSVDTPDPPAALELFQDRIAELRGDAKEGIDRLRTRIESGDSRPSDELRLASLLESAGAAKEARKHYAAFAAAAFGEGPFPGWLQAKLKAPQPES